MLFDLAAHDRALGLTGEIRHFLRSSKLQQSHEANDVEHQSNDSKSEHRDCSGLQSFVELQ